MSLLDITCEEAAVAHMLDTVRTFPELDLGFEVSGVDFVVEWDRLSPASSWVCYLVEDPCKLADALMAYASLEDMVVDYANRVIDLVHERAEALPLAKTEPSLAAERVSS